MTARRQTKASRTDGRPREDNRMAHSLEQRIGRVRFQARRLLALYAVGWTFTVVAVAVLLVGLADYLLRFHDPGIRLMCSLSVLLAFVWAAYRFGVAGWGSPLGDVEIAKRIERRFPSLADRLASTLEFLKQSEIDPQAGSAALRRAVIVETASDTESLDFSEIFERGPTRRALAAAGVAGLVLLAIALTSPESARIALARLAQPLGGETWPKFYNLEFRQAPTRLAAGKTFEVELIDDARHRVPSDARIHYRYETGGGDEFESEAMSRLNGVMVARKEGVTRPFWYRAEGGDDSSMPWIRLEVVEPPRLDGLEVTLFPPAYSGLEAETGEKNIRAVRGTRVEIAGAATKKLRRASVRQESGEDLPLALAADGYGFAIGADAAQPFVVDKSGPYWIILEDHEGLIGGADDRWDIRAITDLAPTITIEQPSGNIFVTPQGEVPLVIAAKDDLAVHEMALHFSRSDRTDVEDFLVPLWNGPPQAPPRESLGPAAGQLGESQTAEHRWSLADLQLKAGAQITFWATASDYLPQVGKSTVRRLSIITPGELEERLAQRQAVIFGELQRVLKMQQDARSQTKSLEIQLQQVGQLNKQDVDHAQSAELNQRQVTRTLTSPTEGIPAQIADFLTDLANNRVDSPEIDRQMSAVRAELDRLGQQHLGAVERDLTSLIKAAQANLPKDGDASKRPVDPLVDASLRSAAANQDQVIDSLEKMLSEMGQWESYRRFARDVASLQRDQEQIAQATKEASQKTLGRDIKELDAQQQADLKKLAAQQVELSRRLEKVQQEMAQTGQSLAETDPLSAATLSDGLHQAEQQAISGQMRQSSQRLERNQLGQAAEQQARIAQDLEELMGILSNRREQELTRLVKQLRESERQLAQLRKDQAGLRKQMRALADKPEGQRKQQLERLAREQKKLEEEAGRLARRLERLQAEQAGRTTSGAAGKMQQAGEAGQGGDAAAADEQAEQAEKDLEEAQQKLAERRRQAEDDLAQEQMARLEDSLKSLQERQKKLIQDTERLENLRASAGRFTRAQLSTVNDLARQQKSLEGETSILAEKLALAEVINLALGGAAKQMTRAAELLTHRETGSATQSSQEAARLRLEQLLVAFQDKKQSPKEGGEEGAGGAAGGKGARSDGNQVLTQLKLLKMLQEDLNGRYRTLTAAESESATAPARELSEIAAEQGRLAELAMKLARPPEDNPEDNPEKLPDVREPNPDGVQQNLDPQLVPPIDIPPPAEKGPS
jgi:hypothetical protein